MKTAYIIIKIICILIFTYVEGCIIYKNVQRIKDNKRKKITNIFEIVVSIILYLVLIYWYIFVANLS